MDEPISSDIFKSHRRNFLALDLPENYQCNIMEYHASHSKLRIGVYKSIPGDMFDLVFTAVYFYDGPMQWIGANFCVASKREQLSLIKRLGWLDGAPLGAKEYLSGELLLFTVESQRPKYKVRIISTDVYTSDRKPAQ